MNYWAVADDVILLQSRLYSPGYAGPGRWILFRPSTRRAFSAIGPDVVPDVIRILAAAGRGASLQDIVDCVAGIEAKDVHRIIESGLLVDAGDHRVGGRSFIAHYHRASHDYPFQDYFDPEWRRKEEELLKMYDALWPPPAAMADREGNFIGLPEAHFEVLESGPGASPIAWLAAVLHYTFGGIGEIPTSRVICLRRTSPSGGARHPTEGILLIPKGLEGIPAGAYWYDVKRHGLVETTEGAEILDTMAVNGGFGIAIRTRVDRAMWRYRDLRAWRPVLLDAGHIVETLSLLATRGGYQTSLYTSPPAARNDLRWINEPNLAILWASQGGSHAEPPCAPRKLSPAAAEDQVYQTNPGAFLSFREGSLCGETVWPDPHLTNLDFVHLRILSHCLPSNRGDRVGTPEGIKEAIPETTNAHLDELCHAGLLLPLSEAAQLYKVSRQWIRHGWYLSLLAALQARAYDGEPPLRSGIQSQDFLGSLAPMLSRRTQRGFPPEPISAGRLSALLSKAIPPSIPVDIQVFVVSLDMVDLAEGVYRWNSEQLSVSPVLGHLSRTDARKMAVGQEPVETASSVILLTRRARIQCAKAYEMDLLDLGRIGQRLCLVAEELNLGLFLTPAVADTHTLATLDVKNPEETVIYLFAIGGKHGR